MRKRNRTRGGEKMEEEEDDIDTKRKDCGKKVEA